MRKTNIELLRILAMLGVVVFHLCSSTYGGGFSSVIPYSGQYYAMYFLFCLCVCSVDLFLMITGYFSFQSDAESVSVRKPVWLLLQVTLFDLFFYFFDILRGTQAFSVGSFLLTALPNNYFVVIYCAVYFLSPYLNKLLRSLSDRQLRKLVITLVILFSLQPIVTEMIANLFGSSYTSGLDMISLFGDQSGYSVVNFLLCYIIGAGMSRVKAPKKRILVLIAAVCFALDLLWILIAKWRGFSSSAEKYNNPLVLAIAAAVFLLFRNWNVPTAKSINFLAKASFTVYLLHLPLLSRLPFSYRALIARFCTYSPVAMAGAIVALAAAVYLVGIPVYLLSEGLHKLACKGIYRPKNNE